MIFKIYSLRILYMSILSPNSHPSFPFLIPPVSPLTFLNLEFLLEFLWLWVCICVCIRLYTTYRVHSVFLICTCVQAWHLEIGQPMWRLLPGGNWFSFLRSQFQPIALHSGAGPCGKPCPHSHVNWPLSLCWFCSGNWIVESSCMNFSLSCLEGAIYCCAFWFSGF